MISQVDPEPTITVRAHRQPSDLRYIVGPLALMTSIVLRAYVVVTLWAWFVVPLGVMGLTMAHAFGLELVVRLLTTNVGSTVNELYHAWRVKEKKPKTPWRATSGAAFAIAMSLAALGMGWIGHSLMVL